MPSTKQAILVVGASGRLGRKIVAALRRKVENRVEVRVLLRSESKAKLIGDAGVKVFIGDLLKPDTLTAPCQDCETVVCAVDGDQDVLVQGQMNLIQAARLAGVRRFLPSQFGFNLNRSIPRHYISLLDSHLQVSQALKDSGMGYNYVVCGCFYETLFSPAMKMVDVASNTINFYGIETTELDLISMDDVATFVAEALLAGSLMNGPIDLLGQLLTFEDVADAYENVFETDVDLNRLGSCEDLRRILNDTRGKLSTAERHLMQLQLLLCTADTGRVAKPMNRQLSSTIKPATLEQWITSHKALLLKNANVVV